MNCRVLDVDTTMKERKGRAIIHLLDHHGYLDIGPISGPASNENSSITFYRSNGSSMKLAVRRFELAYLVGYFSFKDAYLFRVLWKREGHPTLKAAGHPGHGRSLRGSIPMDALNPRFLPPNRGLIKRFLILGLVV